MRRVILTMAVLCALTVTGAGQQPPPRFEVASIKPSAVDSRTPDNVEVQPSGRVIITNTVLEHLVRGVFEVERYKMVVASGFPPGSHPKDGTSSLRDRQSPRSRSNRSEP